MTTEEEKQNQSFEVNIQTYNTFSNMVMEEGHKPIARMVCQYDEDRDNAKEILINLAIPENFNGGIGQEEAVFSIGIEEAKIMIGIFKLHFGI